MKRIQNFESHRSGKQTTKEVNENVFQVEDTYKVRTTIDVPKSLINAYAKKVKDETGEDLKKTFGDFDIAEEIVKHVASKYLDNDILSSRALIGGDEEDNIGGGQDQAQTQVQDFGQDQAQGQNQTQSQDQEQTQGQDQPQDEERAQMQDQDQAQSQAQQQQAQDEEGFEDAQDQGQDEEDEELPI